MQHRHIGSHNLTRGHRNEKGLGLDLVFVQGNKRKKVRGLMQVKECKKMQEKVLVLVSVLV